MDSFRRDFLDGVLLDEATPKKEDGEVQARRQLAAYRTFVAPEIVPLLIEQRLDATFSPGIIVSGQADVLAREPGRLRDLKSGQRRPYCKPQIGIYALLARTWGHDVSETIEDWVPRAPIRHSQPRPVSFVHDLAAAESAGVAMLRHIERDVRTFEDGDPEFSIVAGDPWAFPANPSSMLCGERFCPAHGTEFCREWRAK